MGTYSLLTTPYIFRYVGDDELSFIEKNGVIYSYNPEGTYWTTLLTDDPIYAQDKLSLRDPPKYRVGGFLLKDIKEIDAGSIKRQAVVDPHNGRSGGADEILLSVPVPIFSIFDIRQQRVIYSLLCRRTQP